MKTITVSGKNQIVIPSEVRSRLGIKSGDRLIVQRLSKDEVVLKKEPSYSDFVGTIPNKDGSPVGRVKALRAEWRN